VPLYFTIYSRIVLLSLFSVLVYCEVSFSTLMRQGGKGVMRDA